MPSDLTDGAKLMESALDITPKTFSQYSHYSKTEMGCSLYQRNELPFPNLCDPGMTRSFRISRTGLAVNNPHLAKHTAMLNHGNNNSTLTNRHTTRENNSQVISRITDSEDALSRVVLADCGLMLTFFAKKLLHEPR